MQNWIAYLLPELYRIEQSCTVLCYELYRIEMPFSLLETLNYSKLKLSLKIKIKLYKTYPGRPGSNRTSPGSIRVNPDAVRDNLNAILGQI